MGLLLLLLEGCAQVEIKSEDIYGLHYPPGTGAVHAQTLVAGDEDLSEIQWKQVWAEINAQDEALVCMSSNSFADWKSAIETLCSQGNYCTYPQTQQIQTFFLKLDSIKKLIRKKK